jgi:hypothetical protein
LGRHPVQGNGVSLPIVLGNEIAGFVYAVTTINVPDFEALPHKIYGFRFFPVVQVQGDNLLHNFLT